LIELLVVIAVIAALAALLFPVFSAAQARSQAADCLNNLKQLEACSLVYADDNGYKFIDNLPLAYLPANTNYNNWALGNMSVLAQATNVAFLQRGELFPYTTQASLYHCPADTSRTNGAPRVRSYSMNCWIGSRYMNKGITQGFNAEAGYRTFVMENETALMGTSALWVMADEYEATIDDPWWLVTMDNSRPFASFPATRHAHGYNLAFADGHVERYALHSPNTVWGEQINPENSDWVKLKQISTTPLVAIQ
jgi:prepilin-type processing-associated H-X9-DG protein